LHVAEVVRQIVRNEKVVADDVEICCERLAVLVESTRLRIVHRLLFRGPVTVTELARQLELKIITPLRAANERFACYS